MTDLENMDYPYPLSMIEGKEFAQVCFSNEVHEGKGLKIAFPEDADMQVAIFRVEGNLYCVSNICPHEHTEKMYQGIIDDKKLVCPYHAWTYSLETGKNINLKRGIKSLKKYNIFEKDGKVYIEKPELEIPLWRK